MKYKKAITILVIIIAMLSFMVSLYGVFSNEGPGKGEFISIHGERVELYGRGLYRNDSISIAAQARAQDIVTIILGVPLLLVSLYLTRRNLLKGKLLLVGTLGYFLYTYVSYSFLSMYNSFFLFYVILMSTSFFAFTLSIMGINIKNLPASFKKTLPVKLLSGFLILIGTAIGLMWVGLILPPLMEGMVPPELEHYTTLVIQALDLGFVVPVSILAGILLLKRKPFGYLLSSVMYVKGITMLTALTAMIIGQSSAGVQLDPVEIVIFPLFNLTAIYLFILLIRNVEEKV